LGPASLRNEMCELEQAGYLSHLHTSGGRVPTDKAYRHFVNNLIQNDNFEPAMNEKRKIRTVVSSSDDPYRLNQGIARILSELSDNLVITKILDDDNFYKVGLASLFEMPEFREFDRTFRLVSFFDEFDQMFEKMEREFFGDFEEHTSGFNVFIGRENFLPGIRDETIMTVRYDLPEGLEGLLALVGPTRMDYGRNIGLVKYTTEILNEAAKQV